MFSITVQDDPNDIREYSVYLGSDGQTIVYNGSVLPLTFPANDDQYMRYYYSLLEIGINEDRAYIETALYYQQQFMTHHPDDLTIVQFISVIILYLLNFLPNIPPVSTETIRFTIVEEHIWLTSNPIEHYIPRIPTEGFHYEYLLRMLIQNMYV